MRHGANPILPIESFRLKVRRQLSVVNVENKIQLTMFDQFRDSALPRMKFKMHLVATVRVLPAQARKHDRTNIVRAGNAEVALLPRWIEGSGRDQLFHLRHQTLKLIQDPAAWQREFEAIRRPDQKIILK